MLTKAWAPLLLASDTRGGRSTSISEVRVSTTCTPLLCSSCATCSEMSSTTSVSRSPPMPTAPGSGPPWPGSITTRKRPRGTAGMPPVEGRGRLPPKGVGRTQPPPATSTLPSPTVETSRLDPSPVSSRRQRSRAVPTRRMLRGSSRVPGANSSTRRVVPGSGLPMRTSRRAPLPRRLRGRTGAPGRSIHTRGPFPSLPLS